VPRCRTAPAGPIALDRGDHGIRPLIVTEGGDYLVQPHLVEHLGTAGGECSGQPPGERGVSLDDAGDAVAAE